jgi:hypothetical protein
MGFVALIRILIFGWPLFMWLRRRFGRRLFGRPVRPVSR